MSASGAINSKIKLYGADLHRAVNWWLRSPNSNANNAYNVNNDGTLNNNNVYNANNYCPRPALAYKYAEIE